MAAQTVRPKKMPDIKWKRIGKAGILLNLRTGDYFELDETALAVWKMIDGKTPLDEVVSKLAQTYSAPRATVEKDVNRFVSELRKRKLVDNGKG